MSQLSAKELIICDTKKCEPWIQYDADNRVIRLSTIHTSYQMQVGELGELRHLYYGPQVGDCSITGMISFRDVGFSGNPHDAGRDRTYSFDTLPLEYSSVGNGDYRVCALEVESENGARAVDLRVRHIEAYAGKYSIPGQPALYANEREDGSDAVTCVVTLRDEVLSLTVKLFYGVFFERDVITRSVCVQNESDAPIRLEQVYSFLMDLPGDDWEMMHFTGRHTQERTPVSECLCEGVKAVESKRGMSGHQHNPFVILKRGAVTEESGFCIGAALVYSGSFRIDAQVDQTGALRLTGGINPYRFQWGLGTGESFFTPEVVLGCTKNGLGRLSRIFHNVYRENLMRGPYVKNIRPILVNNWEATYFEFTKEKLLQIADCAKEIGLDMLVLDDGWFGKRDDDYSGLGDWFVNEKKLPGGIGVLADEIRERGLKFGLWIEPEMVSEDSELFRAHPEWCFRVPGREPVRGRYQLNLDVGRPEVRDYVMEHIFKVLDACQADYVKWDMNRGVENVYALDLPPKRQGEALHRYMLGVYDMMERLVARYPDLLFENCSGGGGRFDAGMLYYSPQIWCSDNTDAIERLMIQYGTSFGYPPSAMGAHVSVVPNHQTGRSVSFRTREIVAAAGTFGFELDLTQMTAEEKSEAKRAITRYKDQSELILRGDYDRLTDPSKHENCFWQFASKDKKRIVVSGVLLYTHSNVPETVVYPRRLDPKALYRCTLDQEIRTGAGWMYGGVMLPAQGGDYEAVSFELTRVND